MTSSRRPCSAIRGSRSNKIALQIAHRRACIKKRVRRSAGNIAVTTRRGKGEEPQGKLSRRDKSNIDAEIKALKLQDTQLGGNPMKIGSAGILGKVSGEIDSLNQTASTLVDNRTAIAGASGIGGTLGAASLQVQAFTDQLNVFSPATTQAALAAAAAGDATSAAGDTTAAAPAGPDPALLQQLFDQAHLATSVAEQQLSVLQATPPFGGSLRARRDRPRPIGRAADDHRARRRSRRRAWQHRGARARRRRDGMAQTVHRRPRQPDH